MAIIGGRTKLALSIISNIGKIDHKFRKYFFLILSLLPKSLQTRAIRELQFRNPIIVSLLLTTSCTRRCKYCQFEKILLKSSDRSNDLTLQGLEAMFRSPLTWAVSKIDLAGGEPLLNPDLIPIVRYIAKRGVVMDLISNGDLMTVDMAKRLIENGVREIAISYYGSNRRRIEELARDAFVNSRLSVIYHTTRTEELPGAIEFAIDAGIKKIVIGLTFQIGDRLTPEEKREKFNRFKDIAGDKKYEGRIVIVRPADDMALHLGDFGHCDLVSSNIAISPDLKVSPCCLITPDGAFGTIWEYSDAIRFKRQVNSPTVVPELCRGCYCFVGVCRPAADATPAAGRREKEEEA